MKIRRYDAHETKQMHRAEGMELGSFRARATAFLTDCLIVVLASVLVQVTISLIGGKPGEDIAVEVGLFQGGYAAAWMVAYFGLTTWLFGGRTPGKRLMKLRVISLAHERISLWGSVERALGYGISIAECGFGFLQYFIHPNCRTVHDRIAETIVVRERKAPLPDDAASE